MSSNAVGLGAANGGATVVVSGAKFVGSNRGAARDCIEAVITNLMTRKIGPLMQQHLATLAAPANAGSGSNSTSSSPTPPP